MQAVRNSLKVKPKEEADFRCSRMRMRSNKEPKESKRAELRCLERNRLNFVTLKKRKGGDVGKHNGDNSQGQ